MTLLILGFAIASCSKNSLQISDSPIAPTNSLDFFMIAVDRLSTDDENCVRHVFAHEFGPLFDFANNLNSKALAAPGFNTRDIKNDNDYIHLCKSFMKLGSWDVISWKNSCEVKPENEFLSRDKLCFYNCETRALSIT